MINCKGFLLDETVTMTRLIRHRGPDDEGYMAADSPEADPHCFGGPDTPEAVYFSGTRYQPAAPVVESAAKMACIAFGHRRLSILDLSPLGHQPMCDRLGRYWITYNGEVYNYLELRKELEGEGYSFSTQTDTEVILAAYDKWGTGCQDRFLGMWAFAVYDSREKSIFLSRDRFGIKPLYYWFSPEGTFCFASEIKQFTSLKGWRARLNGQRTADFLFHALTDHTDETMFAGVFHIPAGHCLQVKPDEIRPGSDGRIHTQKWYRPERKAGSTDFSEAVALFRETFRDAVGMHLRSDVPVGSALSGGLDSSAIVCVISDLLSSHGKQSHQKTFTCDSRDPKFSEKQWVDEVVSALNLDARFVYPSYERLDELTPTVLWHQDEPYQTQQSFLSFHVFELAAQNGVKVMLNGQGADEYLSAYGDFRTLRWKEFARKLQYQSLMEELSHDGKNGLRNKLYYLVNPLATLVPTGLKYLLNRRDAKVSRHQQLINLKKENGVYRHPNQINPHGTNSMEEIARYRLFHNPLPKYLRYADRNSMAHSVEARLPFLDHRLPELCMSLPLDFLDGKAESKRLLVHAMKDILPEKVRMRKDKKGFITPEERWVKKDHTAWFRKKAMEAVEVTNGIVSPGFIGYFDRLADGSIPFSLHYIQPILFAEWIRVFGVRNDA
jgi:asparagine synthase (glutamine-hydrolysing)